MFSIGTCIIPQNLVTQYICIHHFDSTIWEIKQSNTEKIYLYGMFSQCIFGIVLKLDLNRWCLLSLSLNIVDMQYAFRIIATHF